jgi:hypothetical protein
VISPHSTRWLKHCTITIRTISISAAVLPGGTPEAVEACARWCDVVSFNLYQRSIDNDHDEWNRFMHSANRL